MLVNTARSKQQLPSNQRVTQTFATVDKEHSVNALCSNPLILHINIKSWKCGEN